MGFCVSKKLESYSTLLKVIYYIAFYIYIHHFAFGINTYSVNVSQYTFQHCLFFGLIFMVVWWLLEI